MKRPRGIRVTAQRHNNDCGVAALAMALGVPYGDVAVLARAFPSLRRGLGLSHLEAMIEQLGRASQRIYRGKEYLVGRSGILGLLGGDMAWCGHWVYLQNGTTVIDPDNGGTVWPLDEYLKRHGARSATLLEVL
jgi:ABC-type bacteriocin/lantibiotic exporter with double-glycine peptidase domain